MIFNAIVSIAAAAVFAGCTDAGIHLHNHTENDSVTFVATNTDILQTENAIKIDTVSNIIPDSVVAFAKSLLGTPYLYASTDPKKGFDCSGFITYVFNHFNIKVPRSSVDFTNYGKDVLLEKAKPGDLILFTGTDSTIRIVGHMGIVESVKDGQLNFIHSSSGKSKGVTISPLGDYYKGRFVKVIRIL